MRSTLKCQPPPPDHNYVLLLAFPLKTGVWNITLGRNSKMIKKDVEPESIIILIKSLSSSLIPPISKYHCRMPIPCFEIQIAQLPLKFIFNIPPPKKKNSNKTNSAHQSKFTFMANTPTGNSRAEGDSSCG